DRRNVPDVPPPSSRRLACRRPRHRQSRAARLRFQDATQREATVETGRVVASVPVGRLLVPVADASQHAVTRAGSWLFRQRTWLPLPLIVALLLSPATTTSR